MAAAATAAHDQDVEKVGRCGRQRWRDNAADSCRQEDVRGERESEPVKESGSHGKQRERTGELQANPVSESLKSWPATQIPVPLLYLPCHRGN